MLGKDLGTMQILCLLMWDSMPDKHLVNAKSCTQLRHTRAHTYFKQPPATCVSYGLRASLIHPCKYNFPSHFGYTLLHHSTITQAAIFLRATSKSKL